MKCKQPIMKHEPKIKTQTIFVLKYCILRGLPPPHAKTRHLGINNIQEDLSSWLRVSLTLVTVRIWYTCMLWE